MRERADGDRPSLSEVTMLGCGLGVMLLRFWMSTLVSTMFAWLHTARPSGVSRCLFRYLEGVGTRQRRLAAGGARTSQSLIRQATKSKSTSSIRGIREAGNHVQFWLRLLEL